MLVLLKGLTEGSTVVTDPHHFLSFTAWVLSTYAMMISSVLMGSIWAVISECVLPCRRGPELRTGITSIHEDVCHKADTETLLEEHPKDTLEEQAISTAQQADA